MHQQGRLNIFQRNYIGHLDHTDYMWILRQFNKLAKQVKNIRNKSVCHERAHTLELTFELAELCRRQNIREFDQQLQHERVSHLLLFVSMLIQYYPMTTILDIRVNISSRVPCRPLMKTFFSNADLFSSSYPNILSISALDDASIATVYSAAKENKV